MEVLNFASETDLWIEFYKSLINFFVLIVFAIISYHTFQKWLVRNNELEKAGREFIKQIKSNESFQQRISIAHLLGDYINKVFIPEKQENVDIEKLKIWMEETIEPERFEDFIFGLSIIKGSLEEIDRITLYDKTWKGITRDFYLEWVIEHYQFWLIILEFINYKKNNGLNKFEDKLNKEMKSTWNSILSDITIPKFYKIFKLDNTIEKSILIGQYKL